MIKRRAVREVRRDPRRQERVSAPVGGRPGRRRTQSDQAREALAAAPEAVGRRRDPVNRIDRPRAGARGVDPAPGTRISTLNNEAAIARRAFPDPRLLPGRQAPSSRSC